MKRKSAPLPGGRDAAESLAQSRARSVNDHPIALGGDYVLYWMQASRRLHHNHALDFAGDLARKLKKPLVIVEALRHDYPWASERHHRFLLEGMADNRADAARLGVSYWPLVTSPDAPARGLMRSLAARACAVVTDDFPCFVVPMQTAALARKSDRAVIAVGSSSIVPLAMLGAPVSAAAHLRPRIHRAFAGAFAARSRPEPLSASRALDPPFAVWDGDADATLERLPLDRAVRSVPGARGGRQAAQERLATFLRSRLGRYADERSTPASPADGAASGLSPYLHYGHISIEEVVSAVLTATYGTIDIAFGTPGKKDSFYGPNPNVNAFLDEAITWRDVGYHFHAHRRDDTESLAKALPSWALSTLAKHAQDRRKYVYSMDQWEAAQTHDPLWNAAQIELRETGTIHNYLRMLWGKKVLEWSRTTEDAYRTLVHLNNKYALDGRDPSSYTGILWCFGLFDRPWAPEREVFGTVRYMSSDNTAKKYKLGRYLRYVEGLRGAARDKK